MDTNRVITLLTRQLAGEASATELTELQQILSNDEDARAAVDTLKYHWNTNPTVDRDFLEATYLLHVNKMSATGVAFNEETGTKADISNLKKSFFDSNIFNRIAVALTGIGIIVYMFFVYQPMANTAALPSTAPPQIAEVTTQAGTRTILLLPDGTKVWLNSGSKITYKKSFDQNPRAVSLAGEAYFEVVKNPNRPFIIHTATVAVKVTGTTLNVKAYERDATTETSLISGSVEIRLASDTAKKYFLKDNQKLILRKNFENKDLVKGNSKEKIAPKETATIAPIGFINGTDVTLETSWTKNILSFSNESFDEVALKIERWYNVQIVFQNKKCQRKLLSGSFENETMEEALSALKYSAGFNFKIDGSTIIIY